MGDSCPAQPGPYGLGQRSKCLRLAHGPPTADHLLKQGVARPEQEHCRMTAPAGGAPSSVTSPARVCFPGSSTSSLAPGPEPGPQPALHVQAQANNSNNKRAASTDDPHELADEWASRSPEAAPLKPSLRQLKQARRLHGAGVTAARPPAAGEAQAMNAPRAPVGTPCLAPAPSPLATAAFPGTAPALPTPDSESEKPD